jgi:hypothetical protein
MKEEYRHRFELPESILSQLEEMSGGGYIIFILDSDNRPSIYESFDGIGQESQVKNFALDWLEAEREVRKEKFKQDILLLYSQNEDEDSDEDSDED